MTFDQTRVGPLSDIRVLDLSRLVAGNMLSAYLADFGADVIKVERPDKGDDLRHWREGGQDIYWKVYGRNKRSIVLDLKTLQGLENLKALVATAHILIENFVPGGLEKMGVGPDVLLKINPRIIIVRVSGWGQTGPYREKPGFGTLVEAMSGFAHLNGFAEKPPALPPLALADMIAGIYGAAGVLTALRVAEKTGVGQTIDLSLFEPIFSVIASEAAKFSVTGEVSMRAGNQSSHTAPRNLYQCSDGKYISMSGSMQSMAMKIFDAIGMPELKTDRRFFDNDARVKNRDELDRIIGRFVAQRSQAENLVIFESASVTAGPVCSVADLMSHPYTMGREAIVLLEDEELGQLPMHNIVPRLEKTPGGFRRPAPKLGQHTEEVLNELRLMGSATSVRSQP
jgi:crotonobetainyl-CoA:carnitine CoA-transferase CaiB-like acyl-CoA transferase